MVHHASFAGEVQWNVSISGRAVGERFKESSLAEAPSPLDPTSSTQRLSVSEEQVFPDHITRSVTTDIMLQHYAPR